MSKNKKYQKTNTLHTRVRTKNASTSTRIRQKSDESQMLHFSGRRNTNELEETQLNFNAPNTSTDFQTVTTTISAANSLHGSTAQNYDEKTNNVLKNSALGDEAKINAAETTPSAREATYLNGSFENKINTTEKNNVRVKSPSNPESRPTLNNDSTRQKRNETTSENRVTLKSYTRVDTALNKLRSGTKSAKEAQYVEVPSVTSKSTKNDNPAKTYNPDEHLILGENGQVTSALIQENSTGIGSNINSNTVKVRQRHKKENFAHEEGALATEQSVRSEKSAGIGKHVKTEKDTALGKGIKPEYSVNKLYPGIFC